MAEDVKNTGAKEETNEQQEHPCADHRNAEHPRAVPDDSSVLIDNDQHEQKAAQNQKRACDPIEDDIELHTGGPWADVHP
jgi:hypothetical protein